MQVQLNTIIQHGIVEKLQHFLDYLIDAEFFGVNFRSPGKTKESMGNCLAAFNAFVNSSQAVVDYFFILKFGVRHGEEVFNEADLLIDNGQWIIDLVTHTGSKPSNRSQLVGMLSFFDVTNLTAVLYFNSIG